MRVCFDPRHDDPCADCDNCAACLDECDESYFENTTLMPDHA